MAAPDGHVATEPVTDGRGTTLALPLRMFQELDALGGVVNTHTWCTVLDDADRARLRQYLPPGTTDAHLQALLACNDDTGLERVWADMRAGRYHPRVVRYLQALRALDRLQHVHRVRAAHNRLVDRLCEARDVWATLPPDTALPDKLAHLAEHRADVPPAGQSFRAVFRPRLDAPPAATRKKQRKT